MGWTKKCACPPLSLEVTTPVNKSMNSMVSSTYARMSASKAVHSWMKLALRATRPTPHGSSRLVQAIAAWSVKTRRVPSRHCGGARVYGHATTAMHDMSTQTPPRKRFADYDREISACAVCRVVNRKWKWCYGTALDVFGSDPRARIQTIRYLFERLRMHSLQLSPSKARLGATDANFLDHSIPHRV